MPLKGEIQTIILISDKIDFRVYSIIRGEGYFIVIIIVKLLQ